MAQLLHWNFIVHIKYDASISFIFKFVSIDFFKGANQRSLAMKIHCILPCLRFYPVDSNDTSAFGSGRKIAWLSPFKGFLQLPNPCCFRRHVEYQLAQKQQLRPNIFRVSYEHRSDFWAFKYLGFIFQK